MASLSMQPILIFDGVETITIDDESEDDIEILEYSKLAPLNLSRVPLSDTFPAVLSYNTCPPHLLPKENKTNAKWKLIVHTWATCAVH